jgi:hypothetical protein
VDIVGIILKGGFAAANSLSSVELIRQIKRDLNQLKIDIANAHLRSAEQALATYLNSNGRKSELSSCAGHLRDVYNISRDARDKVIQNSYLFGIFSSRENAFDPTEQTFITLYLALIARVLCDIYILMNENSNADLWRAEQESCARETEVCLEVKEQIFSRSPHDHDIKNRLLKLLQAISPPFVYEEHTRVRGMRGSGAPHWFDEYHWRVTENGALFLRQIAASNDHVLQNVIRI